MKSARRILLLLFILLMGASLLKAQDISRQERLQSLADHVFHLSEVMLHDAANPPAAARVYAYSLLGAHQVAGLAKGGEPELNSRLRHDPDFRVVTPPKKMDVLFCSNYTMLEVGRQLMPSGYLLEEKKAALVDRYRSEGNFSDREINLMVKFSMEVAGQVVDYAKTDGYNRLSTYPRYTPKKGEGFWYPTPPAYMAAVEPNWETVRPFFLDSAGQYAPPPPAPFSMDTTSSFYGQMREVYDVTRALTDEQREIASFWDCNPFAVSFSGHMAIGLKKISPGGHWIGITGIVCKQANLSLDSAIYAHALVATTLHDAFISCWKEKYTSHRIRPETAINKYLDSEWRPLLQTPPFPEYSSGHSVVSSAVSVVLTRLFGEDFRFNDTSEVYFGLPEREFNSFYEAANEAAMSRLYGGIHFRDACEQGLAQGRKVGEMVVNCQIERQNP